MQDRLKSTLISWVTDPGEGPGEPLPPLLIVRPNWGAKGQKEFFGDQAPLLFQGLYPALLLILNCLWLELLHTTYINVLCHYYNSLQAKFFFILWSEGSGSLCLGYVTIKNDHERRDVFSFAAIISIIDHAMQPHLNK